MNPRHELPPLPEAKPRPPFVPASRKGRFVGWMRSFDGTEALGMIAATTQVLAGLLLTAVALAGQIQPLFLSGLCSMLGCASTMLGGFHWYVVMRRHRHAGHVLHEALNRMLKDQN